MTESLIAAYEGSLRADAFAMPVHWYYDREALDRDYPDLDFFTAPRNPHPDSILWRSSYTPESKEADILFDQAQFWGQRGVHYHQNLTAGENTVNYKLARELYADVSENGNYDRERWAEIYVTKMRTPGWHGDTYVEEYHRAFFTNLAKGKKYRKCGIKDEHIGGLAQVPALVAALGDRPIEEVKATVKDHVGLTHKHNNVMRAADCLTRLMHLIANGQDLREAVMEGAGDWFSTKKAEAWSRQPDRKIIGEKLSPACYIDESFPAALYIAWKYTGDLDAGIRANALVGGDSCHRGAVVGALLGAESRRSIS